MSTCFTQCKISYQENRSKIVRVAISDAMNWSKVYSILLTLLLGIERTYFCQIKELIVDYQTGESVSLSQISYGLSYLVGLLLKRFHSKTLRRSDFLTNGYTSVLKLELSKEFKLPSIYILVVQISLRLLIAAPLVSDRYIFLCEFSAV